MVGDEQLAEAAVMDQISKLGCSETSEDPLLYGSVMSALALDTGVQHGYVAGWLPIELRSLLALPVSIRRAFVLRVLLAWPRELCATVLHLEADDIDQRVQAGAYELAGNTHPGGHIA
jgi:hypothetical protein